MADDKLQEAEAAMQRLFASGERFVSTAAAFEFCDKIRACCAAVPDETELQRRGVDRQEASRIVARTEGVLRALEAFETRARAGSFDPYQAN